MTIAVGVLARDGVVLAADSEITWGYLKTSGEKIRSAQGRSGALAIAGAGAAAYFAAIGDELIDAFQSFQKRTSAAHIRGRFGDILSAFHAKHVVPYGESASVSFWLLFALQQGRNSYLWSTHSAAIASRAPSASIGLGCEYADALLGHVFEGQTIASIDVPLAGRIAAYAAHGTKNNVQNCGKKTSLVILKGGKVVETSASKLLLLNSYFSQHAEVQTLGSRYALGFPYRDEETASINLTTYWKGLRRDMMRIDDFTFEGKTADLE